MTCNCGDRVLARLHSSLSLLPMLLLNDSCVIILVQMQRDRQILIYIYCVVCDFKGQQGVTHISKYQNLLHTYVPIMKY